MELDRSYRADAIKSKVEAAQRMKDLLTSRFDELGDKCPELEFPRNHKLRGVLLRLEHTVMDQYRSLILTSNGLHWHESELRPDGSIYLSDSKKSAQPITYIDEADSAFIIMDKFEERAYRDEVRTKYRSPS